MRKQKDKLEQIVAQSRQYQDERAQTYREQALKMYPWVCGRCGREFTRVNVSELTVHHRDHDHDNNPADGSNWELLCLYCHDNEHARYLDNAVQKQPFEKSHNTRPASHNPFAGLKDLLDNSDS